MNLNFIYGFNMRFFLLIFFVFFYVANLNAMDHAHSDTALLFIKRCLHQQIKKNSTVQGIKEYFSRFNVDKSEPETLSPDDLAIDRAISIIQDWVSIKPADFQIWVRKLNMHYNPQLEDRNDTEALMNALIEESFLLKEKVEMNSDDEHSSNQCCLIPGENTVLNINAVFIHNVEIDKLIRLQELNEKEFLYAAFDSSKKCLKLCVVSRGV